MCLAPIKKLIIFEDLDEKFDDIQLKIDFEIDNRDTSITIQEINDFCKDRGLRCFHQNIRSLEGKFDEIKDISFDCKKIDILSLSEVFITDNTSTNFNIPGYEIISKPRKTGSGGGVGFYIRDQITFIER